MTKITITPAAEKAALDEMNAWQAQEARLETEMNEVYAGDTAIAMGCITQMLADKTTDAEWAKVHKYIERVCRALEATFLPVTDERLARASTEGKP